MGCQQSTNHPIESSPQTPRDIQVLVHGKSSMNERKRSNLEELIREQSQNSFNNDSTYIEFPGIQEEPQILEYKILKRIGEGTLCHVFLTINTENNQYYAFKSYEKYQLLKKTIGEETSLAERFLSEVKILSQLKHPNVIHLHEVIEDEVTNTFNMVVDYADMGPLAKESFKVTAIDENRARNIFQQIGEGIKYIHSKNVIHRDIKPENILICSDGRAMLTDFNVSYKLKTPNELLEDTEGSPAFNSPEECQSEPFDGKKSDVWSYGISLYVMVMGVLPFFDPKDEGVFFSQYYKISQDIIEKDINFDIKEISPQLKDLLQHILDKNPNTRYSIDQVLSHPWFKMA